MAALRWALIVAVFLQSTDFSSPNADVFKKLIPEFIFCFDFVNLRSNKELVEIIMDFPLNVHNRQQKCFLRCLLRRFSVFVEPTGTLWNWHNALEFLMSFGYSSGREPYVKSALYFCVREKELLLSKYGCKNAYNFFKCLTDHGLSFNANKEFWEVRTKYLESNPYGGRDASGHNVTFKVPTRKPRGNTTLQIFNDVTDRNVTDDDYQDLLDLTEGCTQLKEGIANEDDAEKEEDGYDDNADDEDVTYDNPLSIVATEPYRRGPPRAQPRQQFPWHVGRTTISVKIPHIASRANKLNLRWAHMANNE